MPGTSTVPGIFNLSGENRMGINPTGLVPIPDAVRKLKKLSILFPYYNEEKIIVSNIHELIRIMDGLDFHYEIVAVDDGSKDRSFELVKKEFQGNPKVVLAHNFQNFGKGWALKTAFEFSTGDYILFLDSDLELSPYHLPNFMKTMLDHDADVVIGSKLHADSILEYPLKRRIMSFVYYTLIKILFGLPVMDTQTGIKLFTREALELSLPKVLVKKFAFDIELLIILYKHKKKIVSAPIELKFTRGTFGNIHLKTILNTFNDTFAVFYRDKILGFYNRPFGKNERFFYTIILTWDEFGDFEKESLNKFLSINYPQYDILLLGRENPVPAMDNVKFEACEPDAIIEKTQSLIKAGKIRGDFLVFARLDTYPDERFLFYVGRILSLDNVGAAGGFVVLRNKAEQFEAVSFSVLQSLFLNLNMAYRYKPLNFKYVQELQFNSFFIQKDILTYCDLKSEKYVKPEHILSKAVLSRKQKLVYSPDILLYKRFPRSRKELSQYLRKEAYSRASQLKAGLFKEWRSIRDLKFILSIGLIIIILLSIIGALVLKDVRIIMPLVVYYLILYISRLLFYGFVKGSSVFIYIAKAQLEYGAAFLTGLFQRG